MKTSSLLLSLTILTSCDAWRYGHGVVVDSITKQPLDSVVAKSFIGNKIFRSEMVTDSSGKFTGSTGNTGRIVDLEIELSRKNYTTKSIKNPNGDTVLLEKN